MDTQQVHSTSVIPALRDEGAFDGPRASLDSLVALDIKARLRFVWALFACCYATHMFDIE